MTRRLKSLPRNTVLVGDALAQLRRLPSASVDTVITSPPYFRLRNYQVDGQLGLEEHVDEWAEQLRLVMAEVARVLKPSGSAWLNLGDSFSRHPRHGAPKKSLEMLAASPEAGAEERAIHDYSGFGPLRLSEYESIKQVSHVAIGIGEHGPAFAAWASLLSSSEQDELDRFEDCYLGRWDSLTAYAEEYIEEIGIREQVETAAGHLGPYVSIDADALGRDLELGGNITAVEAPDGDVFLFGQ